VGQKGSKTVEKGEAGILAIQFGALVLALLVLSNFISSSGVVSSPISTPTIQNVYWGDPATGVALSKATTNMEAKNASTMSAFYTLASGTTPDGATASRLCLSKNGTGESFSYARVAFLHDAAKHSNYVSFGPTGQSLGETCTYTITLTDSLQQVVTWYATVQVKNATS